MYFLNKNFEKVLNYFEYFWLNFILKYNWKGLWRRHLTSSACWSPPNATGRPSGSAPSSNLWSSAGRRNSPLPSSSPHRITRRTARFTRLSPKWRRGPAPPRRRTSGRVASWSFVSSWGLFACWLGRAVTAWTNIWNPKTLKLQIWQRAWPSRRLELWKKIRRRFSAKRVKL